MRRNEVAEYFGCSDANIKKHLQKFDIKKPFVLECQNKERKAKVECLHCGKEYETQKFRTESEKYDSKYCSYSCAQRSRYLGEEHKRRIRNEIAARRRARIRNQTPELTNEEKIDIVNQHIRNLQLNKYNLSLSVLEESASAVPNQSTIDALQLQINDLDAKISVLTSELNTLQAG